MPPEETIDAGTDGQLVDGGESTEELNAGDVTAGVDETETEQEQTGDNGTETGETETEAGAIKQEPEHKGRASERIRGLIDTNKALQAELESFKTQSQAPQQQEKPDWLYADQKADLLPEIANHPAIKNAEFDENGNVIIDGVAVPPTFAIKQFERDKAINELMGWRQEQEYNAKSAAHQQKIQETQKALLDAVYEDIQTARKATFPQLDDKKAQLVDKQLVTLTDAYVSRAINEGKEYSSELISSCTQIALNEMKETFGIFGAEQMKDNQQYAEQFKTKPTGMPGVPAPKSIDAMTKREREAFADRAAKAAEAMRLQG